MNINLEFLKPYKGIIYFATLTLATHFLWKVAVTGNLRSAEIAILGIDMTAQFETLSQWTANICYSIIKLFPKTETFMAEGTIMYFTDGQMKIRIIWGCTGVKQLYIFTTIILLYSGSFKNKLWYIPLGCIVLWCYNIIRIVAIYFLTKDHAEWFDSLHEGIFRYIFYGLIFLLWLVWEEVFTKKNIQPIKQYNYAST